RGIAECVRAETVPIAVEDIDAAGRGGISGVKARLCAVDRQPRVHGPGGSLTVDLTEGRRAGKTVTAVPSRNCSVQIGEDEARRYDCAVVMCDRERGCVGVADLASRSLRSRCCCRDGDKAVWRDWDLTDVRLALDAVDRGRAKSRPIIPLV